MNIVLYAMLHHTICICSWACVMLPLGGQGEPQASWHGREGHW